MSLKRYNATDEKWETVAGTGTSLQTVYDLIHPVGEQVIGFAAPTVPAGVTATWEVDTSFNGKALWVDTTQVGTELAGSLPKIEGIVSGFPNQYGTPQINASGGAFYEDYEGGNAGWGTSGIDTTVNYKGAKFDASKSNSVYSASAGTNVVRPTSICVGVWKRTA